MAQHTVPKAMYEATASMTAQAAILHLKQARSSWSSTEAVP